MQFIVTAVPLLLLAAIATLIAAAALRGRFTWSPRMRAPRPRKSTLRVSRAQIDKDLADLIHRP
jgi:hypothetical protein